LKSIPSVGKSLMSRIFALSCVTSIARYLTSDGAVRWGQSVRGLGAW
jgi:hypothetical protein